MTEPSRRPWLAVLVTGQVLGRDAEALGKGPWALFVAVILVSTLLVAFPFVQDRFTSALRSTNPALYPGLIDVFKEAKAQKWDLAIENGRLSTGPGVPAEVRVGTWLVEFEPAGGDPKKMQESIGSSGTTVQNVAVFGTSHWGLVVGQTNAQFDGTWEKLSGFHTSDLDKVSAEQLVPILLYASATGGVVPAIFTVMLLMFVQVVFLTVILGFLLSLSRIQIRGTGLGQRRGVGFVSSLKTTGFVALGPALLTSFAGLIPGGSGFGWVAFTLLFGVRIVLIYMNRFRNKTKSVTA
jgi:hypothetical protein